MADSVTWGRVMDINERALRQVQIGSAIKQGPIRTERFDITAASEIMAILCMSQSTEDLRQCLGRIVVGLNAKGEPCTAAQLRAENAMAAILLDAMQSNLVRTLEGNPVFIHGGPFANIGQGTSSVCQTKLCRKRADVVLTEAGFAFDLGGFEFVDLKCCSAHFMPAAIVLVVSARPLRHHGDVGVQQSASGAWEAYGLR